MFLPHIQNVIDSAPAAVQAKKPEPEPTSEPEPEPDSRERQYRRMLAQREENFQAWKNGRETVHPVIVPVEPEPDSAVSSCDNCADCDDSDDTFDDFEQRETAVLTFARELSANRSAVFSGIEWRIESREDSPGFVIHRGTETICSGRYGFEFDTFDRTLSYAVQSARERYVCKPEQSGTGCEIHRRYHKRRSAWVFLVTHSEPLGRRFDKERDRAKRFGGWYAREYRPEYVPGGFMFEHLDNARRFANGYSFSRNSAATMPRNRVKAEPADNTQAGFLGDSATAERLRTLADNMGSTIADKLRPLSQNWTPKRGRELASRQHEGANLARCQEALRVLADHWEAGTVPECLRDAKTKTAVLPMVSTRGDSAGYYDYRDTGVFRIQTEAASKLRELVEASRSESVRQAMQERERQKLIQQAEDKFRGAKDPGFFPTPKDGAAELVRLADIPYMKAECFSVLEPSAGIGSICDAIREHNPTVQIQAVERMIQAAEVCQVKQYETRQGDFLEESPETLGTFDRIIMNPPFEFRQDCRHVQHAFQFLNPGGRLVAIVSASATAGSMREQLEFQRWLAKHNATILERDNMFAGADAFRSTSVSVRIVIVDRPE